MMQETTSDMTVNTPDISNKKSAHEISVEKFLCSYIIPDAKIQMITDHVSELRRKYPQMKSDRIFRKSAEFFRLKKIILT